MSKRPLPGSWSTAPPSRSSSSSMATFFPDRVTPRNANGARRLSSSSHPRPTRPVSGPSDSTNNITSGGLPPASHLPNKPSLTPHIPFTSDKALNGPPSASDLRQKYRSYQTIYDPELSRSKSKGPKAIVRYDGKNSAPPVDPRFEGNTRYIRVSKGKKALVLKLPVPKFQVCVVDLVYNFHDTNYFFFFRKMIIALFPRLPRRY